MYSTLKFENLYTPILTHTNIFCIYIFLTFKVCSAENLTKQRTVVYYYRWIDVMWCNCFVRTLQSKDNVIIYFLVHENMKNYPQKYHTFAVLISLQFFSNCQKQIFFTTKSPLMQDLVFRLGPEHHNFCHPSKNH